jgi:hypothetical protein
MVGKAIIVAAGMVAPNNPIGVPKLPLLNHCEIITKSVMVRMIPPKPRTSRPKRIIGKEFENAVIAEATAKQSSAATPTFLA